MFLKNYILSFPPPLREDKLQQESRNRKDSRFHGNDNRGFTLIELLLYTVIAAGLLLSITALLSLLIQSRTKNETISLIDQEGLQIIQIITQETRNAKMVISPLVSASSTVLQIQNNLGQDIKFDLASNTLYMSKSNQILNLSSSNILVSGLQFSNLSSDMSRNSIKIEFNLSYNNVSNRTEYNYSQTFYDTATLR